MTNKRKEKKAHRRRERLRKRKSGVSPFAAQPSMSSSETIRLESELILVLRDLLSSELGPPPKSMIRDLDSIPASTSPLLRPIKSLIDFLYFEGTWWLDYNTLAAIEGCFVRNSAEREYAILLMLTISNMSGALPLPPSLKSFPLTEYVRDGWLPKRAAVYFDEMPEIETPLCLLRIITQRPGKTEVKRLKRFIAQIISREFDEYRSPKDIDKAVDIIIDLLAHKELCLEEDKGVFERLDHLLSIFTNEIGKGYSLFFCLVGQALIHRLPADLSISHFASLYPSIVSRTLNIPLENLLDSGKIGKILAASSEKDPALALYLQGRCIKVAAMSPEDQIKRDISRINLLVRMDDYLASDEGVALMEECFSNIFNLLAYSGGDLATKLEARLIDFYLEKKYLYAAFDCELGVDRKLAKRFPESLELELQVFIEHSLYDESYSYAKDRINNSKVDYAANSWRMAKGVSRIFQKRGALEEFRMYFYPRIPEENRMDFLADMLRSLYMASYYPYYEDFKRNVREVFGVLPELKLLKERTNDQQLKRLIGDISESSWGMSAKKVPMIKMAKQMQKKRSKRSGSASRQVEFDF